MVYSQSLLEVKAEGVQQVLCTHMTWCISSRIVHALGQTDLLGHRSEQRKEALLVWFGADVPNRKGCLSERYS